jgi:hypothetical protein
VRLPGLGSPTTDDKKKPTRDRAVCSWLIEINRNSREIDCKYTPPPLLHQPVTGGGDGAGKQGPGKPNLNRCLARDSTPTRGLQPPGACLPACLGASKPMGAGGSKPTDVRHVHTPDDKEQGRLGCVCVV